MKPKEKELTNEGLTKEFKDNFELAVAAIRFAQSEVEAGREVTMQRILADIRLNPHLYIKPRPDLESHIE